jgi:hypothetical protein
MALASNHGNMPQTTLDSRHMCLEVVAIACTGNQEEIGKRSAVVLTESPIHRGVRLTVRCRTRQLKGLLRSCGFDKWLGFLMEVRLGAGTKVRAGQRAGSLRSIYLNRPGETKVFHRYDF